MAEISVPVVLHTLRVAPSAGAAASYSGPKLLSLQKSGDYIHGGKGVITGTVEEKAIPNLPLRRKVRLHRDVDGLMVRETWSHATTGAYTFTDINPAYTYHTIAFDYARNYLAVIADNLTPEVAP